MIMYIMEFVVTILLIYGLFRGLLWAWRRADVKNTVDNLETVEDNYEVVNEASKKFSKTKEKKDAINKFK